MMPLTSCTNQSDIIITFGSCSIFVISLLLWILLLTGICLFSFPYLDLDLPFELLRPLGPLLLPLPLFYNKILWFFNSHLLSSNLFIKHMSKNRLSQLDITNITSWTPVSFMYILVGGLWNWFEFRFHIKREIKDDFFTSPVVFIFHIKGVFHVLIACVFVIYCCSCELYFLILCVVWLLKYMRCIIVVLFGWLSWSWS